jgi:hypothetical protein
MTTYKINFEYSIPQFTEIELSADDPDQAEEKANAEFLKLYPEAIDAEVVMVSELVN